MKNHCFLFSWLIVCSLLFGCEKITLAEPSEPPGEQPDTPEEPDSTDRPKREVFWVENDTARFFLSGICIRHIKLNDYPTPERLITNPRYRMPTRLEVLTLLKNQPIPEGYWRDDERILCYDSPEHADEHVGSTTLGTGMYYTYKPFASVTRAGLKTDYCLIPIRTEAKRNPIHLKPSIGLDDHWAIGDTITF